jgi:NADH dehydrogenase
MRILVTGASGILGSRLLLPLQKLLYGTVRVLEHNSTISLSGIERVKGDLLDLKTLKKACCDVDVVVHLAAVTRTQRPNIYFQINCEGTRNLLKACEYCGVSRFVFLSSATATSRYSGGAYAESKKLAEEIVLQFSLNSSIIRLSEIYGPETKEGVSSLIDMMKKYPLIPVIGDGDYVVCPVFIDDVIDCLLDLIICQSKKKRNVCSICGPETITFVDLILRLNKCLQRGTKVVLVPRWLAKISIRLAGLLGLGIAVPDQIPRLLCEKIYHSPDAPLPIGYRPRSIEVGTNSCSQYPAYKGDSGIH